MSVQVAVFVSGGQFPPNADDQCLIDAFNDLGASAEAVVWDAWMSGSHGVGVIRSTWDYDEKSDQFQIFLNDASAALALHNPLATVRWSLDKRYLLELAEAGVPTIPQVLLEAPDWDAIASAARANGWSDFVAKSVISASGRRIVRADGTGGITPSKDVLDVGLPVLVQPFIPDFDRGEYSVVCLGGKVSHCVLKIPAPGEFRVQEDFGGTVRPAVAPPQVAALARDTLEASGRDWSYARVDIVNTAAGPLLVELELLEPELFLPMAPGSAVLLARHILENSR